LIEQKVSQIHFWISLLKHISGSQQLFSCYLYVADLFNFRGKHDRGVFFGVTADQLDPAAGTVKLWGDVGLVQKSDYRKQLLSKIEERFPKRRKQFSCLSKHAAQF